VEFLAVYVREGPFWFNPGEMEQALIMTLLDEMPPAGEAQEPPLNEAVK
jgi:hypothetical protein